MFFIIITLLLALALWLFLKQPVFGAQPEGERLKRLSRSPHYINGQFQNIEFTPQLTEGGTYAGILFDFLFRRSQSRAPRFLKTHKTDLLSLDPMKDVLVWFGHSSYFLQLDGKKFLIDPVLSGNASPVSFTTKSFKGSDIYSVEELPEIDYLLLTHDHYDHLDHLTIVELRTKVGRVITGLGVGAHLEEWGYDPAIISEKDWNESVDLANGFQLNTTTARHFSGRQFKRNNTLWLSFVLTTPHYKIFIGGDSGYGEHFKKIGDLYGPFDLAILENGQYNKHWKHIHLMPEEVIKAAMDLKAKNILPVHWSKFALALHDWDEPITRVTAEAEKNQVSLLTPMIGEAVDLGKMDSKVPWWA
jgi:L-ascorbate metabolism protein UlaG (beta-lactamase superfamily)